jgi:hypothetical protein
MRRALFVLAAPAVLLLAACAKPAWVRAPDFSGWFDRENAVMVEEVSRADACGTAGGESEVTVLPDLASLKAWGASRNLELASTTGKPLPATPYAVVEFGQRPNSGYGLAVSRQAGTRGADLLLKATFFEPTQGRWASDVPSSPCVIVSLPPREYRTVRVLDQTGKVRAGTEGRGS